MLPRKNLIETAKKEGAIDRMNQLLSAAHILNCEANAFVEEASDLMQDYGLMLFQFLMVRLKAFADISRGANNFVSISYGTIKRNIRARYNPLSF